jgi:hypothetical protein
MVMSETVEVEATEVVSPVVIQDLDTILAESRAAADAEAAALETPEEESTETGGQTPQEETPVQDATEDDDAPKYSRREAARLAEQLVESRRVQSDLEKQLELQTASAQELGQEVERVLGSAKEYAEAEALVLDLDKPANERELATRKLNTWRSNRAFYKKLEDNANNAVMGSVSAHFENAAKLEGVDRNILMGKDLTAAFQNVYDAGKNSSQGNVTALQERIQSLEAENKGLKANAMGGGKMPLSQGASFNGIDMSDMFDKDGLLKDDYVALAKSGALRG